MRRLILTLALIPLPLLADPPQPAQIQPDLGPTLTALQFEAYATGKTLSYAQGTQIWGTEQYLEGRRVLWQAVDEPCEYGIWYENDGAICFEYEANPDPSCWLFYQGPNGLIAQFQGGTGYLSEVAQSHEPLTCPGPMIGA